jgi:lysophospholipase L1-like esterase
MDETEPASDESAQPWEAEAEVAVAAVVAPTPEAVLNQADAPQPLRVTALGDSVMVGATPALERAIDGVEVDAALSRQTTTAIDILEERAAAGQLGDVVILHLGNNGTFTARQLDQIMTVLNHVPRVVLVNLRVPRAWEGPNNAVLADGVQRYANAVLVDWHAASSGQASLFWDDGMHLRPDGAEVYAALIAENLVSGR